MGKVTPAYLRVKQGDQFNRWTVIGEVYFVVKPHKTRNRTMKHPKVRCRCRCGKEADVYVHILTNGRSKSCGCYKGEVKARECIARMTTHGLCYHPLSRIWSNMKSRCLCENNQRYKDYGGRGITICLEWLEFEPFYRWAIANGWEHGLTIDRINNDGNYEPANCRWITRGENARNQRRTIRLTAFGETKTLFEWTQDSRCRASLYLLRQRVRRDNWPAEKAITTPH